MTSKNKPQEKHKMSEIDDHILRFFDIKKRLGKGAYGIVWKAIDKKTNQTLAVKKIFDAFRDETDAQRTFREIMFLRAFRNHPNVIELHNVYKAANNLDIYLSFEFMESDLHNVIKKGNILKDVHKRYIMYQLLNAIKYIHSGNVIHRDLKPSNVLIDTKCRCKVADFGLARSVSSQQVRDASDANEPMEPVLTDYVATRWYRAPEILVASKSYTKGIDMWSLGCILGEMIRGKPIFQGSSTVNQIEKIVSAMPEITDEDILAVGAGFGTALLNKQISTNNMATLDELLIDGTSDATNLVKRLLVLDPLARLTASEALTHRYVEKFRHSIQEIELNVDVRPPFRDDVRLSVTEYRAKLYEIVQRTERTNLGKPPTYIRKRDPRAENKSVDSILSKYNASTEKPKRSIYRSQERKSYIPNPVFDAATTTAKVTVNSSNNRVHIITPPASNSGTVPKNQQFMNHITDQSQTDAKIQNMLSKTKHIIKSTVNRHGHQSVANNTISSPEISRIQRTPSRSVKPIMDKRHSVDESYNHDTPSSTGHHVVLLSGKERINNGSGNNYCPINKQSDRSSFRMRRSGQNHSAAQKYHTETSEPIETGRTKFEDYTDINNGSSYYEKRLKRLEDQIEKHKRDVNAFCSENTKCSKSMTFKRNPDQPSEHRVLYNDNKYAMMSTGTGKTLQMRPKVSSNSYKNPSKYGSASRFEYLYAGGDDIDRRQELPPKCNDRNSSKIV